jgi:hypothetical protein
MFLVFISNFANLRLSLHIDIDAFNEFNLDIYTPHIQQILIQNASDSIQQLIFTKHLFL